MVSTFPHLRKQNPGEHPLPACGARELMTVAQAACTVFDPCTEWAAAIDDQEACIHLQVD
jgi:hypothetical protein